MKSSILVDNKIFFENIPDWNIIQQNISSCKLINDFQNPYLFKIFSNHNINEEHALIELAIDYIDNNNNFTEISELYHTIKLDTDIKVLEKKLSKSHTLEIQEINFFHKVFKIAQVIKTPYPHKILKDISSFIDNQGQVRYDTHFQLQKYYFKIKELEITINKTIKVIASKLSSQNLLQFDGVDFINDMYVLAIRSDRYKSALGRIIAHSKSGQTLFVEPTEIRSLNISLVENNQLLEEAIHKIKVKISRTLNESYHEVTSTLHSIIKKEAHFTKAIFAKKLNLSQPVIQSDIVIREGFYPPIENCTPNSLNLDDSMVGVIISGANTGGKTVYLKTIMMNFIFAKLGFYTPSEKSTLKLPKSIFWLGGDHQNIKDGLSSFGSDIEEFTKIMNACDEDSLIFIDEVFNSTSSDEASALAFSLFELLTKRNNKVFVSTHHQLLKTLTHKAGNYLCGHVIFDAELLKATYKVTNGTPGPSLGINIFKELTKNEDFSKLVFNEAEHLLKNKNRTYESLLEKVSLREGQLNKLVQENQALNIQLKNQKKSTKEALRLEKEKELKVYKKKIKHLLGDLKDLTKKRRSVEEQKVITSAVDLTKEPEYQNKNFQLKKVSKIEIGKFYFHSILSRDVKVLSIKNQKCTILAGKIKSQASLNDLFQAQNQQHKQVKIESPAISHSSSSIHQDCRGMRAEAFEDLLESVCSDLLLEKVPFITIVHGHGTGALKKVLKEFLRKNKDIQINPIEDGNSGQSQLILKK